MASDIQRIAQDILDALDSPEYKDEVDSVRHSAVAAILRGVRLEGDDSAIADALIGLGWNALAARFRLRIIRERERDELVSAVQTYFAAYENAKEGEMHLVTIAWSNMQSAARKVLKGEGNG